MCRPCAVFASYTLAFALQLRKKHGKTSVTVVEKCPDIPVAVAQCTVYMYKMDGHTENLVFLQWLSTKITVYWDMEPCSLVHVQSRVTGTFSVYVYMYRQWTYR
jgi:hypothetical protein